MKSVEMQLAVRLERFFAIGLGALIFTLGGGCVAPCRAILMTREALSERLVATDPGTSLLVRARHSSISVHPTPYLRTALVLRVEVYASHYEEAFVGIVGDETFVLGLRDGTLQRLCELDGIHLDSSLARLSYALDVARFSFAGRQRFRVVASAEEVRETVPPSRRSRLAPLADRLLQLRRPVVTENGTVRLFAVIGADLVQLEMRESTVEARVIATLPFD